MQEQKSNVVVGIDLGTTFSAIAYISPDTHRAELIPGPDQERITPSVVLFEDQTNVIVGKIAKQNAVAEPTKVVEFVKRQMGKPKENTTNGQGQEIEGWHFALDSKMYSAQEISAFILKKLKTDAEQRLGMSISDAVITCPAYFGDAERAATKEAGMIAGFNVLGILDEPVAAALSYGLEKADKEQRVFVFDLGGGTFDVVILEIKGGQIRELAVNGDHRLGGKNWDDEIIKYISYAFVERYGSDPQEDPSSYQDLQLRAIQAKEQLSKLKKTTVTCSHSGHMLNVEMDREKFEEITQHLTDRCKELCGIILDESKMKWQDIDTVLLVGGSTRMPMIQKLVVQISGKVPNTELNPDECVALGAAWQAEIIRRGANPDPGKDPIGKKIGGISVQKVSSHNLGVIAIDPQNKERSYVLIPKFTPLPHEITDDSFSTMHENQNNLKIRITEGGVAGNDGTCDPESCNQIAEGLIDSLPPSPKGSPVAITLRYNDNGILEAHARHTPSGKDVKISVDRAASLTDQEIREATQDIQKATITA